MTTRDPDLPPADPQKETPKPRFAIGHILIIVALLVLFQALFSIPRADSLTYSEFKTLLAAGKVREALVGQRTISGEFVLDSIDAFLPAARVAVLRRSAGKRRASRNRSSRLASTIRRSSASSRPRRSTSPVVLKTHGCREF